MAQSCQTGVKILLPNAPVIHDEASQDSLTLCHPDSTFFNGSFSVKDPWLTEG